MKVKSLLLLINPINDFVHEQGKMNEALEMVQTYDLLNRMNQAILWCRRHQIPIVFMHTGFHDNYIDLPMHSSLYAHVKEKEALKIGSWGCELHEDLFVDPVDTRLIKHRISPFYGTELEQILSTHSINTLLVGGLFSSIDIESCIRDAHDRDYYSIVLRDISIDHSLAHHELALEKMAPFTKIRKLSDLKEK